MKENQHVNGEKEDTSDIIFFFGPLFCSVPSAVTGISLVDDMGKKSVEIINMTRKEDMRELNEILKGKNCKSILKIIRPTSSPQQTWILILSLKLI